MSHPDLSNLFLFCICPQGGLYTGKRYVYGKALMVPYAFLWDYSDEINKMVSSGPEITDPSNQDLSDILQKWCGWTLSSEASTGLWYITLDTPDHLTSLLNNNKASFRVVQYVIYKPHSDMSTS